MLSPKQERERALKVSQLYGQTLIKPRAMDAKPLSLSPAIVCGLVLAIPSVAFATLQDIYRNTSYWNLPDVQGASMIFIPSLMAVFAIAVVSIRYVYAKLNNSYIFSTGVFWIGLCLVIGLSISLFELTTGSGMQSPVEIMARIGLFTAGIGLVSVMVFVTLVRILYRRNNKV
jgi:hypothetical protein